MSHSQKRGQEHFRRFCVHADMLPSRYLSSCVQNDFRIGTVAAILANKNEILICDNAVTAIRIGPFHLITQIDIVVFQKPNRGTVGKWIWQIYIRTGQQIQVIYRKSRDAESVYLTDQLTFQKRKVFVSLCDAAAAEGMSLAPFTPSACRQPVAFFAAIISAICRHTLYLRIKLENAYFLDSKTTVSTWHEEMILLTHTSYLFVQCRIETYPPFCALELSPMQEHFDKLEFVRIQNRIYCQGLTVSIHPCSFQYL